MSETPMDGPSQSGASVTTRHRFEFTGNGSEYFRIWIVNIALTLLTLGIYSAWAKVRTRRYLYGNTSVAGGHFDYHADPKVILRGRIIAMVLLGIYLLLSEFYPIMVLAFFVVLAITLPWIVVRSLAFNARNTSWRNMRLNFIGQPAQAFGAYVGWNVIGFITLGLAMPYAWYKTADFGVSNHRLGRTPFEMRATGSDFYAIALALTLAGFAAFAVVGVLGFFAATLVSSAEELDSAVIAPLAVPLIILFYALYFNIYAALRFQTIYQDLGLGDNNISTNMTVMGYTRIAVVNTFAMLFTLGLYYPWAKVAITRYLAESLEVEATDIDSFVASSEEENSALFEEFGEAFDLDIGV